MKFSGKAVFPRWIDKFLFWKRRWCTQGCIEENVKGGLSFFSSREGSVSIGAWKTPNFNESIRTMVEYKWRFMIYFKFPLHLSNTYLLNFLCLFHNSNVQISGKIYKSLFMLPLDYTNMMWESNLDPSIEPCLKVHPIYLH